MLGAIIGLTLVLGAIIMAVGNGALADVVIFPFAIFSLMIGAGFVAGMLLGIIAGILALLRRNR
jgi:thiamine transporter ThiT